MKLVVRHLAIAAVCAAGVFSAAAHAAQTPYYVYGNVAANFADAGSDDHAVPADFNSATTRSWDTSKGSAGFAGDLGIGYRFSPYLAAEFGYAYLGKMTNDWSGHWDSASAPSGERSYASNQDVSMQGLRVAILGIYPLSNKWDVFGSFGLYGLWYGTSPTADMAAQGVSKTTAFKIRPAVGAGVTYRLGEHLSVRGQYEFINTSMSKSVGLAGFPEMRVGNTHSIKLGLTYQF